MMVLASQAAFVRPSWLTHLDPRVKLWFTLLGVMLCLLARPLGVLIGVVVAVHLILLLGGITGRHLRRIWLALSPILIVILILQPILISGEGSVVWRIGSLAVTRAGLLIGVRYALRVAGAAFVVLTLVLATPVDRLVRALEKLGLPYNWALTTGLALRYLGTLGDLYTSISEAQQARGWDLSQGRMLKRARAFIPTLVALIVASLRLSDGLALGLSARGFGVSTGRPRTVLDDIAMRPIDWLAFAIVSGAFAAVFIWLFLA